MQEVQGETVRGDDIEERDPDVFDLFEEVDHARADGYFLHVIGGLDVRQDFLIGIDAEECGEDEREGDEDFDMLGDEREDQVPVHGVEHAEQVCGKEESVVVEETCQFRPGDEQGDPDGEQREQGEPFLTEAQQKRAHEEYRGDERDVPIGQDHVAVQQRLEKFPASRRQLGETGHLSRIGIPKEGVSCEKKRTGSHTEQ